MHRTRDGPRSTTAAIRAIAHIDGDTTVEAQGAGGEFLSFGGTVVQHVGHIVPFVSGVAKVGTNLAVVVMIIAMTADALGGIGPKTHQLRHGRCEAAHNGVAARTIRVFWTATIIGIALIPLGLTEIARTASMTRDESPVLEHRSPLCGHIGCGNGLAQLQHTLGHTVKIIGQRGRDIGSIECRCVRITNDGTMGVVASNDDEAVVADIIDKKRIVQARIHKFGHSALRNELRRGEFLGSR